MRLTEIVKLPARVTANLAVALALACPSLVKAQGAQGPEKPAQTPAPAVGAGGTTAAPGGSEALAKQLSNPVASLVSVPFQLNWDEGLGSDDEGRRFLLNFQPVLPFKLNEACNLIARVITPVLAQPVLVEGGEPRFGLSDIVLSFFLSPSKGGLIWGAGPVIALPVTYDPVLGSGKYGLGPTVVVLKQSGPFTYGALVNHVWSIGGDAGRADVNQTFLQPFVAYGKKGWTISVNSESTANWKAESGEKWTVPINVSLSKVVKLGRRPMSIGAGPRFYVDAPSGGPSWGFRLSLTLLFPTGA